MLRGKESFARVAALADYAREEINRIGGYYAFSKELINGDSIYDFDTTKLSIHTLEIGLAGIEVYDILRDEYDIQIEFGDIGNILAYLSIGDRIQEIERLVSALAEVKRRYQKDKTGMLSQEYIEPEVIMSPQDSFYAEKEAVPIRESEGRICSEFVMCYPPGIPILAPGEKITKDVIEYILYAKEKGCSMTGPGTGDFKDKYSDIRGIKVMEMWFSDEHTDNVKLSIRVDKQLFSAQSEFQRIDVLESKEFGKILVADGDLMLTEKDEFIYHEMMAHVPMAVHPKVENVLVIGGGDGGCVRELAKYNTIQKIDVVEVDPLLVEVCRKYFPQIASSLDDDRVTIYNEDGLRFVRSRSNVYDLILIDSPNPFGPAEGLFTKEFYGNCYNALHEDGIMINQHESPFYTEEAFQCQRMHKRIIESFPISKIYQAHIPSYPSGHWLFGFASKKYHPLNDLDGVSWNLRGIHTKYYLPRVHHGVFALPAYVEELVKDVE